MKRLFFINLIFLGLVLHFLFFQKTNVWSQNTDLGLAQVCLLATRCDQTNECRNFSGVEVHSVLLKTDSRFRPPPNKKLYLVEMVNIDGTPVYHTGIKTDRFPSGKEAFRTVGVEDYNFVGFFNLQGENITNNNNTNPTTTNDQGEITPIIWEDKTIEREMTRMFLGFFELDQTDNSKRNFESGGAIQQSQIDFYFDYANRECIKIAWDPYGRVFDSETLEPVKGVVVTLFKKDSSGNFILVTQNDAIAGQITNPQTTGSGGNFSFIVVDGTYKLDVSGNGVTFPVSSLSQINQNYSQIYSDIYPAETRLEIIQKGKIEHRDIPVKVVPPTNNPVVLIERFYQRNIVSGTVSHPFTTINFYSKIITETTAVRYRLIGTAIADKEGKFSFKFDQTQFDKEKKEFFGEIELIKRDLTTLSFNKNGFLRKIASFLKQVISSKNNLVNAQGLQSTTISFEPIPSYIDGYAYDQNGKVIPNAKVMVMLNELVVPYYQTTADENGYFKISSEFLPPEEYYLKYSSSITGIINTTTSDFIKQNNRYLTENKVNLNSYKNIKGEVIQPSTKSANLQSTTITPQKANNNFSNRSFPNLSQSKENNQEQKNNPFLLIVIVLIVLIIAVIGIGLYYIAKNRSLRQPFSPSL